MAHLERWSKVENSSYISEAEIDKVRLQIILQSKQLFIIFRKLISKVQRFPFSQSCSLWASRPYFNHYQKLFPIFLANLSKRLLMLNAVHILISSAIEYVHLELQIVPPQDYSQRTCPKYGKQLSSAKQQIHILFIFLMQ